ncbi:MAG: LPS export ABC transporter permease LptG [Alphaproteobacteria bacterium]
MRLSPTLTGYVARQFTVWYLSFLFGLLGVILLATAVDLLDRLANKDASLAVVAQMVLLKLPFLTQEVMPFTVLFAGLACFWRLTRSHELVVTRAAGISVWQVLVPVLGVALVVGGVTVTVLNPLAAVLLGRYEQFEAKYIHNQASTLSVSRHGLWLRQADEGGQSVIHASRITHEDMTLYNVIVFHFAEGDRFIGRVDAERAVLQPGYWQLTNAWKSSPGTRELFVEKLDIPTDLSREKILDSFAPPETISFWSLPDFIELLENAGFSATHHKLQLHRLLATPLLLAALVLLAASFSLRPQRRGRVGIVILGGVLTGFLLYFVSNIVFALGLSGTIPVILSAWTPASVTLMLGIAVLLHLEDG